LRMYSTTEFIGEATGIIRSQMLYTGYPGIITILSRLKKRIVSINSLQMQ
jgi:hypothetical protein